MAVTRARLLLVLVAVLGLSAARRHEIHSSASELRVRRDTAELYIRVFADDLAASVAAHVRAPTPEDSSVGLDALDAYVRSRTRVQSGPGSVWHFTRCGVARLGEAYRLCYRAVGVSLATALQVRFTLLMDRHADQVNILRLEAAGRRRTVILTAARPSATVALR